MTGDDHNPTEGGEEWAEDAAHEAGEGHGELDLDHQDEHLPWLDSGHEDYAEYEPNDNKRMLGFVGMGLAALAVIVYGIWWGTHRTTDPALVADGSTIAASDQPYKEAPKNPGGKTFEGTGDSSFAVSQGQNKPAQLGEGGKPAMAAGADVAGGKPAAAGGNAPAGAAPAKPAAAPAAPAGGVAVQVGAYSSHDSAEAGWQKLVGRVGALGAVSHRIVEGDADIGKVYRLQAIAADAAAANGLCGKLKADGVACQVK